MPRDFNTDSQRRRLRFSSLMRSTIQVSMSEEIPASVSSSSLLAGSKAGEQASDALRSSDSR